LEVLAAFRPDPHLAAELGDIDEDPTDAGYGAANQCRTVSLPGK
jgi:hypothetical protein